MLGVAGVLVVTAAVGFCPLYRLLGLSTCPVGKHCPATAARALESLTCRSNPMH